MHTAASVARRQQTFGYTEEELRILLAADGPHRRRGARLDGHRHARSPCCPTRPRLLFDYFTQLFAQVTNPPLDAIREELVTSLGTTHRPRGQRADGHARRTPASCVLPFPVIDNDELAKIVHINADGDLPGYATHVVRGLYDVHRRRRRACEARLEEIFAEVSAAIADGARFVVLSDRDSGRDLAPIPSLLLTSAVHHHLIREKTRTQVGLLVEAGDVREVHHVALLIGYGAAAVNPYLAMETVEDLVRSGEHRPASPPEKAVANLIKALGKGVLKVMSKMGISTVASYRGAQVFEAIGLSQELVDRYFTGTRLPARRRRPRRHRRRGRGPARDAPTRPTASGCRTASSTSAASTSGAARASRTCSTPTRSSGCSTPPAQRRYDIFKQYTAAGRRAVRAADDAARAVRASAAATRARRCRSRRSSRSARSSSGSTPAR